MNKVFSPTLVISVGPSSKKALEFLNNMIEDLPSDITNVINLYQVDSLEKTIDHIQRVIDEKLLSARNINRLVDLGYKIRTESTSNIRINIFVFWDVYGIEFPMKRLIEALFQVNYCVMDKSKHSGVSLFLLPMLDREWSFNEKANISSVRELKSIIELLSKEESMINIDSKVYLTHTISNDGLRIPKEELEYLLAIVTYLTILPSENPLLSNYNKRILMNEGNFKIGTLGISTLTVFKDKVREEFSAYLTNDLLSRAISYEEKVDYNLYSSSDNINWNKISQCLKEDVPLIEDDKELVIPKEFKIKLPKEKLRFKRVSRYFNIIKYGEENLKENYIKILLKKIIDKSDNFLNDTKVQLNRDLNTIILNYSLIEGERFLQTMLDKAESQSLIFKSKEMKSRDEAMDNLNTMVSSYPNFKGFWTKISFVLIFFFYSMISVLNKVNLFSPTIRIILTLSILILMIGFISLEYLYMDKKFMKKINKYIDEIYKKEANVLNSQIDIEVSRYYENLIDYLEERLNIVKSCIKNCENISINTEDFKNRKESNIEILVTDLMTYEDRKKFYMDKRIYIPDIYARLIRDIKSFEVFKESSFKDILRKFVDNITNDYVNIDFYHYVLFKWGDRLSLQVGDWIEKSLIKSKELLQYNQDFNLEEHRLFVGSSEFIDESLDIIMKKINDYKIVPIDGKDIYTNCISLIKLTLGIELNKITPFIYLKEGNDK